MSGFGAIGPKSERQRKKRKPNRPPGGGGEKSLSSGWAGASRPVPALYSLDAPAQKRIIDLPRRWGLPRFTSCLPWPKHVGGVGASGPRRASQTSGPPAAPPAGQVLVTPDSSLTFAVNMRLLQGLFLLGGPVLKWFYAQRKTGLALLTPPGSGTPNSGWYP